MNGAVDFGILRRITEAHFVPVVFKAFGERGTSAMREVLGFLPRYFARANPEHIKGTLYVIRALVSEGIGPALQGSYYDEKHIDHLPDRCAGTTVIELFETGRFRVWTNPTIDFGKASQTAIVYRFTPNGEDMIVSGVPHAILNPAPASCSVFCRPIFGSLVEALEDYSRQRIRTSTCLLFRQAWEDEAVRLFFIEKPERHMRRSLQQYLEVRLRDADVLPEQNIDETHPVDIKVKWHFTISEALIEIKWLGKSRNSGKIMAYFEGRARHGAKQLVDYLDAYRQTNPDTDATGYLVIIDARRYRLSDDATSVSRKNGMYYSDYEIEYDPEYEKQRLDFAAPVRMFAEPVCTQDQH